MRRQETKELIRIKRNEDIKVKKEKGLYIGRTVPYGYKLVDKKLIIDKETSHIVFLIYNLYDKGYTNTQIANYLNDRYILSPSSYNFCGKYMLFYNKDYNREWKRGMIRKILKNKVYNGYYKYSNVKTHEEIINDKLFESVQCRINDKQNLVGYDMFYKNKNIFSGKVYCSECGKSFTLGYSKCNNSIKKYLRCGSYDTRRQNRVECSNKLAIGYDELFDILSIYIEENVFNLIDVDILREYYISNLKEYNINDLRKYLKQEKKLLLENLDYCTDSNYLIKDLCDIISTKKDLNNEIIYKKRIKEIDKILKNINSFSRKKEVKNNELYLDRNVIETFIDKIKIGKIENNNRNIEITFK